MKKYEVRYATSGGEGIVTIYADQYSINKFSRVVEFIDVARHPVAIVFNVHCVREISQCCTSLSDQIKSTSLIKYRSLDNGENVTIGEVS